MKEYFTQEQKKDGLNAIELEDLIFYGEYVEGEGKTYRIYGSAIVEEEKYNDFVIEFELEKEPDSQDLEVIMNSQWDSYDYIFEDWTGEDNEENK